MCTLLLPLVLRTNPTIQADPLATVEYMRLSRHPFPFDLAIAIPEMSAPHSLLYLGQARAAAGLMSAVAHGDECMSLLCGPGLSTAAVLDEAENELSRHGLRCVRVYGPASGGLTLRDLVAQIVPRADPDALTDGDLKAGFVTLTEPGDGYGRVVLLVTEAQNLRPSAMRYIQLACRSSPTLRVALAGQPDLAVALARDEFAGLRQCITRTLELPGPVRDAAPGLLSVLAGLCRNGAGPLVRLGVAAASVLLVATAEWRHGPAPSEAAIQAGDAALPLRSPAVERHCRDITPHAQSGEDLSDAGQTSPRDGCRAK